MSKVPAAAPSAQASPEADAVHASLKDSAAVDAQTPQANADAPPAPAAKADPAAPAAKADAPAADPKPAEPEAEKPVVPEKYDLKLPEGSILDPARLESIASFAKEKGLSSEQAQAIVERESDAVSSFMSKQKSEYEARQQAWQTESVQDAEIGGEAFSKNAELSKRVMARFGSEKFLDILDKTGLGNHPELVRVFKRIGDAMSEDQLVLPNATGSGQEKRIEDIFYPQQKQS